MARNVEIKARVADLDAFRVSVEKLNCDDSFALKQTDTFFNVAHGRLKLREFGDGTGELIFYVRDDRPEAKLSSYQRTACADPSAMRALLDEAFGVRGVVKKHREVFLQGNARFHLDAVEGLGSFFELEIVLGDGDDIAVAEIRAAELLETLDIDRSSLIDRAYIDLLEEFVTINVNGTRGAP